MNFDLAGSFGVKLLHELWVETALITFKYFVKAITGIVVVVLLGGADLPPERITLSLTSGTNMAASLSPDAKIIIFGLQGTLWQIDIDGGKAKALTDPLSDSRQPQWSPDGKQIAFQSFQDGNWHIWLLNRDGSDLRQVTNGPQDDREPFWHPSGKRIVFSSDRSGNYDLWSIELVDAKMKQLTDNPSNEHSPAWSPDGNRLAFISDRTEAPGLYVQGESTDAKLLVTEDHSWAAPAWNEKGDTLALVRVEKSGSSLVTYSIENGALNVVSAPEEDVFLFRASWNAERLFYTADGKIKWRQPNEGEPTEIPFSADVQLERPRYDHKVHNFRDEQDWPVLGLLGPAVSPDGSKIAFTALGDLWLLDGGSKPKPLTHDPYMDLDPTWSPDGSKIAYVSDRGGKMDLWIYELADKSHRRLAELPSEVMFPSWSPDGQRIAFYQTLGSNGLSPSNLSVFHLDSGEVEQVHAPLWGASRAAWSPDGKSLAVSNLAPVSSRYNPGVNKITIISLNGEPDRYLTVNPEGSLGMRGRNGPVWSPDGKWIAYNQGGLLWAAPMTPDGQIAGPSRQLTRELADQPSWTGDSRTLVYLATDILKRVNLETGVTSDIPLDLTWRHQIQKERWVLHAGRLFNGRDNQYQENVDIIIDGNSIVAIEPHRTRNPDERLVDASDFTVIPGLFERHTHQSAGLGERAGRIWLAFGITSVREPGAEPFDALERKESWASGQRLGPRLFYAGSQMDGTRTVYAFSNTILTDEQLELELERAQRLDYDLIKTYVRMPDHMQKRVIAKAHEIGIPVTSHELYPAVAVGGDATEHFGGLSRRGYSAKQSGNIISYDDFFELITKSGMVVTPTLGPRGGFALLVDRNPNLLQNRQYTALYNDNARRGAERFIRRMAGDLTLVEQRIKRMQDLVRRLVDRGGRVTAGTDSPIIPYGLSLLAEIEIFVDGGLTPFQALQTATLWPAEEMGVADQLGTIEPGKLADLTILQGDPLADIRALYDVQGVVANGVYITLEELLNGPSN